MDLPFELTVVDRPSVPQCLQLGLQLRDLALVGLLVESVLDHRLHNLRPGGLHDLPDGLRLVHLEHLVEIAHLPLQLADSGLGVSEASEGVAQVVFGLAKVVLRGGQQVLELGDLVLESLGLGVEAGVLLVLQLPELVLEALDLIVGLLQLGLGLLLLPFGCFGGAPEVVGQAELVVVLVVDFI